MAEERLVITHPLALDKGWYWFGPRDWIGGVFEGGELSPPHMASENRVSRLHRDYHRIPEELWLLTLRDVTCTRPKALQQPFFSDERELVICSAQILFRITGHEWLANSTQNRPGMPYWPIAQWVLNEQPELGRPLW